MAKISVDFSNVIGKMKPVHGIGQPPIMGSTSLFRFLTDAGIPFSRLHDVGGYLGGGRYVDVPNIFRDFDADENDPANYDFAFTDILINGLIESGVEPFFRLGVTIENTEIKIYRVYPPKDFHKWARICEHIIMHYTEGWADGFHHKIDYWEIWNEPDNAPDDAESLIHNHMWQGTRQEFYELYTVAAKHLKSRFPHLKIGGYGSCGFYAISNTAYEGNDIGNSTPRHKYFITFFTEFLEYIRKNNAPLDFFSWHNYRGFKGAAEYAAYAREMLDKYGYKDAITTCNEWSTEMRRGTQADVATRILTEILAYQNSCVDQAMAYDGRCYGSAYSMLFNSDTQRPRLSYFCFKSFDRLYRLKNQTEISSNEGNLIVISASDGCRGGIIILNPTNVEIPLEFCGIGKFDRCYITEEDMPDFESMQLPRFISPKSFVTILTDVDK